MKFCIYFEMHSYPEMHPPVLQLYPTNEIMPIKIPIEKQMCLASFFDLVLQPKLLALNVQEQTKRICCNKSWWKTAQERDQLSFNKDIANMHQNVYSKCCTNIRKYGNHFLWQIYFILTPLLLKLNT